MNMQENWGFSASGYEKGEGDNSKTKPNNVDQAIYDNIAQGEWEAVFSSLAQQAPSSRISLLWDILMETDLNDLNQLEEKIYLYGRSLGTKDSFGRIVFTRMAMILRNAQNVTV